MVRGLQDPRELGDRQPAPHRPHASVVQGLQDPREHWRGTSMTTSPRTLQWSGGCKTPASRRPVVLLGPGSGTSVVRGLQDPREGPAAVGACTWLRASVVRGLQDPRELLAPRTRERATPSFSGPGVAKPPRVPALAALASSISRLQWSGGCKTPANWRGPRPDTPATPGFSGPGVAKPPRARTASASARRRSGFSGRGVAKPPRGLWSRRRV